MKLLLSLILIISFNALALENQELELIKLHTFTEDVRDIIIELPDGHPMPNGEFNLSTKQADQMNALSSLDESMRGFLDSTGEEECNEETAAAVAKLEERVNEREFQISAVVVSTDKKFEQSVIGDFSENEYQTYLWGQYNSGKSKAYNVYTIDLLESKFKALNPSANLDQMGLIEKVNTLNDFITQYLGEALPEGVLLKEMTFTEMTRSPAEWKKFIGEAKANLTSEQKIQLVSRVGGAFGNEYNTARSNESSSDGFVDMEHLLSSVKNSTPGGVCRDIALAQTQLLKELGLKNNYVVAFKTNTGNHATVISTDPVTGQTVKFNYGETTRMDKGAGVEGLRQDTSQPDVGLAFRVYDTNGKPVTKVSSELAQILKDASNGGPDREFVQKNYSISKVGFSTENVDGNLFSGKTSSGDMIYGVATNLKLGAGDAVQIGTSLSKIESQRNLLKMDQTNLFVNVRSELSTDSYRIGSTDNKLVGGAESSLLISETVMDRGYGQPEKTNWLDYDFRPYAGVENKYQRGNTTVDSSATVNFYPDWKHSASSDAIIPTVNSVVLRSGVTQVINPDTKALIDTAVVMRKYGNNIVVRANLQDDRTGMTYSAGGTAPLTNNMPSFLPGSEKRLFMGVGKTTERFIFTIEYEKDLVDDSNRINAKGEVKF